MIDTKIQWTDHTWNVAVGCTKIDFDCKFCYMYRDAGRFKFDPKVVRQTSTVFNLPLRIKEPSKIFTSSLTDLFHPDIDPWRGKVWDIIKQCPQHTFQVLTKRPERIMDNLPADWGSLGYPNVWLGTSVGHPGAMNRIQDLIGIPATIRFISFEPLWAPIDMNIDLVDLINIDWVIIGGESGNETGKHRYRACEIEWIESLIDDLQITSKIFVKQLGTHLAKQFGLKHKHGGDMNEWPKMLQIREFPILKN